MSISFSFNLSVVNLFLTTFSLELHNLTTGYLKTYFFTQATGTPTPDVTTDNVFNNSTLTCPVTSFYFDTSALITVPSSGTIGIPAGDLQSNNFIVAKACVSTMSVNTITDLNKSHGAATAGVVLLKAQTLHTSPGAVPLANVYGSVDTGGVAPSRVISFYFPVNTAATSASLSTLNLHVDGTIS